MNLPPYVMEVLAHASPRAQQAMINNDITLNETYGVRWEVGSRLYRFGVRYQSKPAQMLWSGEVIDAPLSLQNSRQGTSPIHVLTQLIDYCTYHIATARAEADVALHLAPPVIRDHIHDWHMDKPITWRVDHTPNQTTVYTIGQDPERTDSARWSARWHAATHRPSILLAAGPTPYEALVRLFIKKHQQLRS